MASSPPTPKPRSSVHWRLDGKNVMARFYMGMAADQDGRRADADKIWRELLASAPPGAPWIEVVRHAIARDAPGIAANAPPAPNAPGPSAADVAAAGQMNAQDRDQMIRGMVTRLADKLKQDGSDIDGWERLLRAYMVLGERDKAHAAAADARKALAAIQTSFVASTQCSRVSASKAERHILRTHAARGPPITGFTLLPGFGPLYNER